MIKTLFGQKINKTRIFPVTTKIIFVFGLIILISNLTSHYLSLTMNRNELVKVMKQVLVKELKDLYGFATTQYELFQYNQDMKTALNAFEIKASNDFKNQKSLFLGIKPGGDFLLEINKQKKTGSFTDQNTLALMEANRQKNIMEGYINFQYQNEEYFGIYKYHPRWNIYLLRGEELTEFYAESTRIFEKILIIIGLITIVSVIIGILILRHLLRFLKIITRKILEMNESQEMGMIELKNAPNDDISFLGIAFNSLSSTINNLLSIFRKFTNKDVVVKIYKEKEIRLEGSRMELTCLFSDIKSFTNMTEILGTDIIKLLNLHYNRAIEEIILHDGIIGSIIGDALLAVYGVLNEQNLNKSFLSVKSAYRIQEVAKSLREKMQAKKDRIEAEKGHLDEAEEKVYQAVLLQVGVGIDGGTVFYGNIGSNDRMTNTVIGDNVNSASRLEGLTREYFVPVICSEYIKNDIEQNVKNHGLAFIELDTVQVKGKTIGKKIFWPIFTKNMTQELESNLPYFSEGLKLYYSGNWPQAYKKFSQCNLELARIFKERTKENTCPEGWNGIWAMKTK